MLQSRIWRIKNKDYLYQKKLHLTSIERKLEVMEQDEWDSLDVKALGVLSFEKIVAYKIVNLNTTYGLIKENSIMYQKPLATNKVFMIRPFVNMNMKEGGPVLSVLIN